MTFLDGLDWGTHYFFQAHRDPTMAAVLEVIGVLGSLPALVLVLFLMCLGLRIQQRYAAILYLVGCFVTSVIVVETAKLIVGREHPDYWTGAAYLGGSFPCAPAWLSLVVYGAGISILVETASPWYRSPVRALAMGVVLLIGFSQLYLGHFFLFDVLAGWLGGGAILLMGRQLMRQLPRSEPQ